MGDPHPVPAIVWTVTPPVDNEAPITPFGQVMSATPLKSRGSTNTRGVPPGRRERRLERVGGDQSAEAALRLGASIAATKRSTHGSSMSAGREVVSLAARTAPSSSRAVSIKAS